MTTQTLIGVALGGALGAMARYGLHQWAARQWGDRFPWGTLIVNVLGCFLLGFVIEMVWRSSWTHPWVRVAIPVGLLGGFTTFSTFSYETLQHMNAGQWGVVVTNVLAHVVLALGATFLGVVLARALAAN